MATADAILRGDRERLIGFSPVEHPVALRLGGSEPDDLAQTARSADALPYAARTDKRLTFRPLGRGLTTISTSLSSRMRSFIRRSIEKLVVRPFMSAVTSGCARPSTSAARRCVSFRSRMALWI